MATISGVARPAYVYDAANNQWVPIGVGPHTHSLADLPSVVSTNGGSTIVNQAPTLKPLIIQGASGQSANLFEIQNSTGTATYTYTSAGDIGIGTTNITGRVSVSGPNATTDLTIEAFNDSTKRHIIRADNDILRLVGTWTGGTPGGQIAFNTGGATGGERLRIDASGNVRIGDFVEPDTLRYFDIYNRNTGSNAGAIIRFITNNATSSAVTTVDMVKYKNGNFVIANNDTTGNAHLFYNSGGVNAFVVNPAGNMGIQLRNQTSPTPSNQASLEVNTTGSGLTAAWFKNFAGSQAAPTETADWPNPVVAITALGNYFRQTMLRFSLPNDNLWQTDNASWNFKLNGVTATGWDNNGNTTPKITSDADLGLELIGPGNLRIGSQNARAILFCTSNTDQGKVDSNGYMLLGYANSNGAYRLQVNSQIFATSGSIATSDARYKENVEELTGGLDMIKALRPVEFNWKAQEDVVVDEKVVREAHAFPEGKTVGFIAQEVQEALGDKPWINNLIKENVREAVKDIEGNELAAEEEFLGIAETNLIAVLVSAVKELTAKVEALEAKLAE
jgi:hypothetical protein